MKIIIKTNKYISFFCLLLLILIIFVPLNTYGAEETKELKENEEIKNPFFDYRKNNTTENQKSNNNIKNNNENQSNIKNKSEEKITSYEKIKIKDKRIEPSFYWQGLILVGDKYKILLEFNNETHIMGVGDKLEGYQIINIDSNKITLSKDNYIYYLKMRRE